MSGEFVTPGIEHIPTCAIQEARPCTISANGAHRWSGWPGAYCQDCGHEDKGEHCLGADCKCPCHTDFWEQYNQYLKDHDESMLSVCHACKIVQNELIGACRDCGKELEFVPVVDGLYFKGET